MTQAAALTINDGQATPVATTFNPVVGQLGADFYDRASGISTTFRKVRISTKLASANSSVNRSTLEVAIPIGVTVDGVTSVAYTLRAKCELILPDGCTAAQRSDLYAFLSNALANTTLVRPAMRDYDPLF